MNSIRFFGVPHYINARHNNSIPSSPKKDIDLQNDLIIKKGPPTIQYRFDTRQEQFLPRKPFLVYDSLGKETELHFEEDGIFSNPTNGDKSERIFYNEIRDVRFIPIRGQEKYFYQIVFKTVFGERSYYYIPIVFRECIKRAIANYY